MTDDSLKTTLNAMYDSYSECEVMMHYENRHGIKSAEVLTVHDDFTAGSITEYLSPRIKDKVVVEIGGGIGLLALHMGTIAKKVYCIEANPIWAHSFLAVLIAAKPKNVSYLFGSADEFAGLIKADYAIICTHSGIESMKEAGRLFAPEVIDVYGELIVRHPESFDKIAASLRNLV